METEITFGGGVPRIHQGGVLMTSDSDHDLESKFIREAKRTENKAGVIAKQLKLDKVKMESGESRSASTTVRTTQWQLSRMK